MVTVEEYKSEKIFGYMKQIDTAVKLLNIPLIKNIVRRKLTEKLEKHSGDFIVALPEDVDILINSAEIVAIGPRMCYHLYKKDLSYAIFLDELAKALIQIGYAKEISKEDAIIVMKEGKKRGRLQLISNVSGKPLELCNQSRKTCSLWKLEKAGFKIIAGKCTSKANI
ncbi:MAG: hypothetical protein ACNA7I_07835 [Candidatus Methanoperedens sp.]|nr:hypothetical protein [Candidatus Methanoperedens sp.]